MKLPKRFELHRAAAPKPQPATGLHLDTVHIGDYELLASDGVSAAVVPILGPDERPGADLPRRESGEELKLGPLPLQAVREASKGTTGIGTLRTGEHSTEAQAASGKAWLRVENPGPQGQVPNFQAVLETTETQAPPTHRYVTVCLDAQRLAGIAAAIGANEAVRLRFLVDKESGRADAAGLAHGVVDVRPIRENDGGRGVLMIHVVSE
jgi:hypothetical protein